MAESRTIRVHLNNEHYDIESGALLLFPLHPPEPFLSRLRSREQLQLQGTPIVQGVVERMPVYDPGEYIAMATEIVFKEKRGDRRITVPALGVRSVIITQSDIDTGDYRMAFPSAGKVMVSLVDNEDRPLAGQQFSINAKGESGGMGGQADADGRAVIDLTVGDYGLSLVDGEQLEVSIGEFEEVNVTLRRPGGSCLVTVVGQHGEPVASTWVVASPGTLPQNPFHARPTDEQGRAFFGGLEPGTYTFYLKDQPLSSASVTIEGLDQASIALTAG